MIEKIKRLIKSSIKEDNIIGLELLCQYILDRGLDNLQELRPVSHTGTVNTFHFSALECNWRTGGVPYVGVPSKFCVNFGSRYVVCVYGERTNARIRSRDNSIIYNPVL